MNAPIPIRPPQREPDCRLHNVNRNIEKLAQSPEGANAYLVFKAAANLAADAITIASDLRRLHRTDARHLVVWGALNAGDYIVFRIKLYLHHQPYYGKPQQP